MSKLFAWFVLLIVAGLLFTMLRDAPIFTGAPRVTGIESKINLGIAVILAVIAAPALHALLRRT